MKKILALVFSISISLSAVASINNDSSVANKEVQEKVYTKVDTKDVPATILKEITEKYPDYTINTAFKAEDGSDYKLVVGKGTTTVTVFYDAKGEFVKEQK